MKKQKFTKKMLNRLEALYNLYKEKKLKLLDIKDAYNRPSMKKISTFKLCKKELKEAGLTNIGIVSYNKCDFSMLGIDEDYGYTTLTYLTKKYTYCVMYTKFYNKLIFAIKTLNLS